MVSVLQNVAIDCADAYELARFWSSVTGRPLHPECEPGDPETEVMLAEGPVLHFNQVPESKEIKNRIHLCLRPETSREQEVERLVARRRPVPCSPRGFAVVEFRWTSSSSTEQAPSSAA
ncbi:VOC family protein [Saccharopolyspora sp. 5N102]|uniref:VOC family protein n=1 Tax=Saccharopolyspora sp. 5N102 TaxID=3375155 RepID=UPI00379E5F4F